MNQTYEWITSEFLKHVLEKYLKENVEVLNFTVTPAIPVGENYTSDLIKIKVNYANSRENKLVSVITKCSPNDELLINYAKDMKLFEQEIGFYNEVVPAINNLDYVEKISANTIYVSHETNRIMLEDLTQLGFKMYPREIGLDLRHCLLAIEKIAYFHAASVAIYEKNPSLVTKYNLGIYWNNPFTVRWITTGFNALIETCTEWSYLNKYVNKLKCVQNHLLEKALATTNPTDTINVLNHGDFWTNNFMFSYNKNNEVHDMVFVDFQVILFSSPALDLNYFWATSPNVNVLSEHLNTVLDCYYNKFVEVLGKLHVSVGIPDRKQLKDEFKSKAFYGLIGLVTVLPLVTSSRRSDASFDQFFNNDSKDGFRYDCFNNHRYREKVTQLLNLYDNLDVLN